MANASGTPVWYELATPEPDAAERFYGAVLGWHVQPPPAGAERDYRIASTDTGVAGIMRAPPGYTQAPLWHVYFGVTDVDAATDRLRTLGGTVHIEPTDIPGVGRFCFVTDPHGASFYLMRGASEGDSRAFSPDAAGHCSWNELVTSDQRAALEFYGALFGWEKLGAMPMGEMGDYTFIGASGQRFGAMMNRRDPNDPPFWNFSFHVADIDQARAAIEDGGGTVASGPMQLPDGSGWLIQARDPAGARVMFDGPRSEGA